MAVTFAPGTLHIPNEVQADTAAVIVSATGALLSGSIVQVRTGEGGAVLASGTFIVGDKTGGATLIGTKIYNSAFGLIASPVPFALLQWNDFSPMASDFNATFYVSKKRDPTDFAKVRAISSAGVLGATTWILAIKDLCSIGVDEANTILYYTSLTAGDPIRRWDLIADVALPNLVAGVPLTTFGPDLLMIPDTGTFITLASTDSGVHLNEVRQYLASDGSLIRTIAVINDADDYSQARMALDLGTPSLTFWLRTFQDATGATSTFRQIELASGATIRTYTIPMASADPTKIPVSCPFFAWSSIAIPVIDPPTLQWGIHRCDSKPRTEQSS